MAFKKKSRGPRLPVPKVRAPRGLAGRQQSPMTPPPGITPGPNDFSAADEQSMRRNTAAARMAANAGPPGPSSMPADAKGLPGYEDGEPIPS